MIDPALVWLISVGGALLFASAVVHKARRPQLFAATLAHYRVLPRRVVGLAAGVIIALEAAVAFGLIWPDTREICGVIGSALLVSYAGAIGLNLLRGRREIDCGCARRPQPIRSWMMVRNAVLAVLLLLPSLPANARPLEWFDGLTLIAGLMVAATLYASIDTVLETP